jgi:hypothetical protein
MLSKRWLQIHINAIFLMLWWHVKIMDLFVRGANTIEYKLHDGNCVDWALCHYDI